MEALRSVWDFIQNQILGMRWLSKAIGSGLAALGLDPSSKIGGSIQFFLYDTIKIMVLLGVLILIISYIQSYFPPERTKHILGRFRGIGANCVAALLGTVTPFCSCSSIPLFIGFTSAGLPLGVTFSFLISSPMVDLGSLVLLIACRAAPAQVSHDLIGLPQQRGPVIFPFFMDHTEQFPQSDHTACGVLRKVGGRKERLLVGCHEDAGRPTAAAGERLTDRHVDGVNIRSLLLVHLDGNKIPVQKLRDLLILKALMGHDMTPVAGAVSDAEKDRFILLSGPTERLLTPGIPLYRILRVLEQIGACLVFQMV